jgi:hypothetical protein
MVKVGGLNGWDLSGENLKTSPFVPTCRHVGLIQKMQLQWRQKLPKAFITQIIQEIGCITTQAFFVLKQCLVTEEKIPLSHSL